MVVLQADLVDWDKHSGLLKWGFGSKYALVTTAWVFIELVEEEGEIVDRLFAKDAKLLKFCSSSFMAETIALEEASSFRGWSYDEHRDLMREINIFRQQSKGLAKEVVRARLAAWFRAPPRMGKRWRYCIICKPI